MQSSPDELKNNPYLHFNISGRGNILTTVKEYVETIYFKAFCKHAETLERTLEWLDGQAEAQRNVTNLFASIKGSGLS